MDILPTTINRALACTMALILSILVAATASAGEYVSVKKDGVNVRSGPSTKDEVRWEVFSNFPLEVLKRTGDWAEVADFEGDKGWIHTSLISPTRSVIVRRNKVNLRDEPNSDNNNRVVAIVKYGVVFTPIEKKGEWLKVRHADGTGGWIHRDLVWPPDPLD